MGTQSDFAQMVDCVKKYQIVPVVDSVFPLSDAETAIQKMANSTQMGKIVLEVCE
jgi:D-arabinose 1-dehydrogenase-like Zn-dependent alcohol dehydrogenase